MLKRKTVSQCISSDYCKGWNDAVDKMPGWISVDDRLPDNCVQVLICYDNGFISIGYWDDDLCEWDGLDDEEITKPSYWMPLPEPPKED